MFPMYPIQDQYPKLSIPSPLTPKIAISAFMKNIEKILMIAAVFTTTLTQASPWNASNDPAIFDSHYDYRLNAFETKAILSVDKTPWSETYWPLKQGGINNRWNSKNPAGFDYALPTREQVMHMSKEELEQLSPAEKYDLAMGHYDYPLHAQVAKEVSKKAQDWEGICNGWSVAALHYPEPLPNDVVNPDGVVIPFGSSDVKGLLSYFIASASEDELPVSQVGLRCEKFENLFGIGGCRDVNAGTMHVILTNQIAGKKEGFVADIDPGIEIWNQPTYGYEYKILGSAKSAHSKNAVRVQMKMIYANELDVSSWTPVIGTPKFQQGEKIYDYILELDHDGKITGGQWISQDRPDFFWKAQQIPQFTGDFAGLSRIYKAN